MPGDVPECPPDFCLPNAIEFRAWLRAALKLVSMSATKADQMSGLSGNVATTFLREPGRDITLTKAAQLHRTIKREAKAKGIDLLPLCVVFGDRE
jgi:hypothetical protein